MAKQTIKVFGKIDILVNNVGITTRNKLGDLNKEEWDNVMNVDRKGAFLCCKAVISVMKKPKWKNN